MDPILPPISSPPIKYSSIKSVKQKKMGHIEGIVTKIGEIRIVTMKTGQIKHVQSITLKDGSDKISITLWEKHILPDLELDDKLQIRALYVKESSYTQQLEGSLSKDGHIRRIAWPLSVDLPRTEQNFLIELKRIVKHNIPVLSRVTPKSYGMKLFENHVVELGLYLLGIPEIPVSIGHLTHLQCLYAPNNHLSHLPLSLCHLSRLHTLDVQWNRLTELPPHMEKLQNLQTLNISENNIRILPDSLGQCKKLAFLEFDNNPIESISESLSLSILPKYSEHIFPLLPDQEKKALICLELQLQEKLPELALITQNSFGYVQENNHIAGIGLYLQHLREFPLVLFNFCNLRVLNIAKNHLTELPNIGDHLPYLTKIFLRDNRWDSLPSSISSYLSRRYSREITNISEIDVILELETMLDEIIPRLSPNSEEPFGFVIESGHITALHLDCKNLTKLPESFHVCSHLQKFSANSNHFQTIPSILSSCQKLSRLTMASNQISQIPPWISTMKKLEILDLQYNQLSRLPPEFILLSSLHTLNLRSNKITELSPSFGDLQALQKVDLGNNELTTLPVSFAALTHLTHLYLNQNQLAHIPESILHLQSLEELDLLWNPIKLSPQGVAEIHAKLRYDNFTLQTRTSGKVNFAQMNLPAKEVQGLIGLEFLLGRALILDDSLTYRKFGVTISDGHVVHLSLPHLELGSFPEIIGNFRHLETLSLAYNEIHAIPHIIGTFENLHSLYLNSNKISEISDLIGHTSLKILNLNNNQLEFLPDGFLNLVDLEECRLEHNPWHDIPHVLWNSHKLVTLKVTRRDFPPMTQSSIRGGITAIIDYAYRRSFFYEDMLRKLEHNHTLSAFDKSHPDICRYAPMLEKKCQELNNTTAKQLLALFNENCFIQKEQFKIWL
ncbi:MAG: leucine-rich repeat domain-containing protein [Promethearchaeota archaeon]